MEISIVQFESCLGNLSLNRDKIESFAKEASTSGNQLVVFPELCDLGYDRHIIEKNAVSADNTFQWLQRLSRENKIGIVLGAAEKTETAIRNSIFATDSSGYLLGHYSKTHLFTGAPGKEQDWLEPGSELMTFDYLDFKFGLAVCYEVRFPEVFRTLALQGAEVVIVTAAFPLSRVEHWKTLLTARAIENQIFIVASNRTGIDSGLEFAGNSGIITPQGEWIAKHELGEALLDGTIDKQYLLSTRESLSVFADRRPNLYKETSNF